jgi:hypothetical protein
VDDMMANSSSELARACADFLWRQHATLRSLGLPVVATALGLLAAMRSSRPPIYKNGGDCAGAYRLRVFRFSPKRAFRLKMPRASTTGSRIRRPAQYDARYRD